MQAYRLKLSLQARSEEEDGEKMNTRRSTTFAQDAAITALAALIASAVIITALRFLASFL
jgi:hypothetical protein